MAAGLAQERGVAVNRQLCLNHPAVDYTKEWGCPECVKELCDECVALRAKNAMLKRMIDLNANIEASFVDGTPEAMVAQICKLTHERDSLNVQLGQTRADVVKLREALQKVIDYAGAAGAPRLHTIAAEALSEAKSKCREH